MSAPPSPADSPPSAPTTPPAALDASLHGSPMHDASRRRQVLRITALLMLCVVANFLLQWRTDGVADWKQFAFYDPGTTLKGDWLLAKGYVPSIDFGYTHGLLSLVFGRIGFAILGRTPFAFLLLNLLLELVMAWALARILVAIRANAGALALFCLAIPIAIQPAYLTLTHPLEAALILLALADQMENRHGRALLALTICLFVKPSMAYVYGFILLLIILASRKNITRKLLPAAVAFVITFGTLAAWFGLQPVISTLLPLTGARTYATTHFGFFNESGRQFWHPELLRDYFIRPTLVYLLLAAAAAAGPILFAAARLQKSGRPLPPALTALAMAGLLNTAFLLGFYGWAQSWTYYSYLPVLALACWFTLIRPFPRTQSILAASMGVAIILASVTMIIQSVASWAVKIKTPDTAGLWCWEPISVEWAKVQQNIRSAAGANPHPRVLIIANGYFPTLPADYQMMDAWFPERGIPTPRELERVRKQVEAADFVIHWNYANFENVWFDPALDTVRGQFNPLENQTYSMTALQRTR